jgi:hypothetical protein
MRCESCGSEVVRLRGATGRVTICGRCGWGRVELAERRRMLSAVARDDLAEVRQKGWRVADSSL